MIQGRPSRGARAHDLDSGDGSDAEGVYDAKGEVVGSSTVAEPDVDVSWDRAGDSLVAGRNHAGGEGAIALESAHGDVGEVEVDAVCWEGTAVCEVDFGAVVCSGAT